jgi:hypothetical protein
MAITPNTTFTAGAILTAAQMNRLPWGVTGYASATANQNVTTLTDLTGLTVTFTAVSTRIYKTTIHIPIVQQTSANGYGQLYLTNSSNTQLQWAQEYRLTNYQSFMTLTYVESGISGSTTRKARAEASGGGLTFYGASTSPMQIVVEDIGQA